MPKLLMFAAIRDAAGVREDTVDGSTVGEALKIASEKYGPEFERVLSLCSILLGDEMVTRDRHWDTAVAPDEEIALLPPVSGGADTKMVDVGDKDETLREATAECRLTGEPEVMRRLIAGELKKGDAVSAAKVAGVMAAKRTPELIPLCHPVRTTFVGIEIPPAVGASGSFGSKQQENRGIITIRAIVRGRDRTGFEMEALTACSVAALTLYDMAKADDPRMRIEGLRIVAKSGGKSGSVTFE